MPNFDSRPCGRLFFAQYCGHSHYDLSHHDHRFFELDFGASLWHIESDLLSLF
jgi:hypothetical protein